MTESPASLPASAQARLTELETRLAFTDDLLETLNGVVVRQQAQIDLLQDQLRLLHQRLKDALPEDARGPRDEIPPHY